MKVLIGARCVFDHNKVKENEALEICTPAVMAVDCSRDLVSGMIRGELVRVMDLLADCNPGRLQPRQLRGEPYPHGQDGACG